MRTLDPRLWTAADLAMSEQAPVVELLQEEVARLTAQRDRLAGMLARHRCDSVHPGRGLRGGACGDCLAAIHNLADAPGQK